MSTEFGTDVAGATGVTATLRVERRQRQVLVDQLVKRLSSRKIWYSNAVTIDLRSFVGSTVPAGVVETRAANALLEDERVRDARATVERIPQDDGSVKLEVGIVVVTDLGTFDFVLSVDSLTVELLEDD